MPKELELHYHIDLLPTVSELLGKTPEAAWDGISYAKTLKQGQSDGREYLLISQCAQSAKEALDLAIGYICVPTLLLKA